MIVSNLRDKGGPPVLRVKKKYLKFSCSRIHGECPYNSVPYFFEKKIDVVKEKKGTKERGAKGPTYSNPRNPRERAHQRLGPTQRSLLKFGAREFRVQSADHYANLPRI